MIVKIYKLISNIIFIPILIYFLLRLLFSKESKQSIMEKFFFIKSKRPKGKVIWINGVSIGEAKSGLIVAEEILKKQPNTKILFSTSTQTAHQIISNLKKNIILIYTPIDINFVIQKFLNHWRPQQTIFMESEIWPNIISELSSKQISFTILNARMSKKSFFIWKKMMFFSKKIFPIINYCFAQDEDSKNRFQILGVKNVKVMTNLKFLSPIQKIDTNKYRTLRKNLHKKIIITLFSCHEDEELILVNCYKKLKKKYDKLFFIIIPRHIHKKDKILNNLKNNNLDFLIRTTSNKNLSGQSFYLVDTYGELNLFFKLSDIAIVGGSFKKIGGHNPIEVSNHNCVLLFGPEMFNFKEIKKKIVQAKAGFEVFNYHDLSKKIELIINNTKLKKKMTSNLKKLCSHESKKAKLVLKQIAQ